MDNNVEAGKKERKRKAAEEDHILTASDLCQLEKEAEKVRFLRQAGHRHLDTGIKLAALKATPFVVSLVAFSGKKLLSMGSGAIIESLNNTNTVFTSLHLVRKSTNLARRESTKQHFAKNSVAKDLKIVIRCYDAYEYIADVIYCDYHYNLLVVQFKSKNPLPCAHLRFLDDDIGSTEAGIGPTDVIGPSSASSGPDDGIIPDVIGLARHVMCRAGVGDDIGHSSHVIIPAADGCAIGPWELRSCPKRDPMLVTTDNPIVSVGRFYFKSRSDETLESMISPGFFRIDTYEPSMYDCKELLPSNCTIAKCADGSPVINLSGEVIGILFDRAFKSVLPINVAYKWWSHYSQFKESRHPYYGFEACCLYAVRTALLEEFVNKFPSASSGVFVQKVLLDSDAHSAGLHEHDVIVSCDGRNVKSFFELWSLMWEKVGEVVELKVLRMDDRTLHSIKLKVAEASDVKVNKWPPLFK